MERFEALRESQDEIDAELGVGKTLDWQPMENRRACPVAVERTGSIDDVEAALAEIREWMITRLLKFKEVFGPRIAELA